MNRMETSFFLLNCKHNLIITGLARYNPKSDFRFFLKSVSASGFVFLYSLFDESGSSNPLKQAKYKKCPFNKGARIKVNIQATRLFGPTLVFGFCGIKRLGVFTPPRLGCYSIAVLFPCIKNRTNESITKLETFQSMWRKG